MDYADFRTFPTVGKLVGYCANNHPLRIKYLDLSERTCGREDWTNAQRWSTVFVVINRVLERHGGLKQRAFELWFLPGRESDRAKFTSRRMLARELGVPKTTLNDWFDKLLLEIQKEAWKEGLMDDPDGWDEGQEHGAGAIS